MKRHSAIAIATVFATLLAFATTASAATRYASPAGVPSPACAEATPCNLVTAVLSAALNDTVVVKPGSYTAAGVTVVNPGVDVVGESGGAKPVLNLTGPVVFAATASGSKLRNVVVNGPPGVAALVANSAVTIADVEVSTASQCVILTAPGTTVADSKLTQSAASGQCLIGPANTTVRNVEVATNNASSASPGVQLIGSGISVDRLVTSGSGGVLVAAGIPGGQPPVIRRSRITVTSSASLGPPAALVVSEAVVTDTLVRVTGLGAVAVLATGGKLRNVTGIATGTASRGLSLQLPFGPVTPVSAKNSIFRGADAASDVVVDPPLPFMCAPTCPPGPDLTITNSNFRDKTGTLNAASGPNQTADPQFTDDFRPKAGSPVIDAGTDDADLGSLDLDGKTRKIGSAVDIGAFEFEPPATPLPPISAPGGNNQPDVELPIDGIAPALSALGVTNKTFAVGAQATPVAAARAKKGTTFVYTLSEPATVTVTIEQSQSGRRKGRSCVKATKKNRKAKKCTRYVRKGAISRKGAAGPNALPFSGRIGKKALATGSYRAVLVGVDIAGNRSKSKTVAFKIVKK
jgi:hypothetical protein